MGTETFLVLPRGQISPAHLTGTTDVPSSCSGECSTERSPEQGSVPGILWNMSDICLPQWGTHQLHPNVRRVCTADRLLKMEHRHKFSLSSQVQLNIDLAARAASRTEPRSCHSS